MLCRIRQARLLAPEVDINQLAGETKNFSGAEIEGLIKSATSFAFARQVSFDNLKQARGPALCSDTRQEGG